MKTLIVYTSKYGTTEECVNRIVANLDGDVTNINLNNENINDITKFDTILIGGPIYFGNGQKLIKRFIKKNELQISKKNVGLFITCFESAEKVTKHFSKAFPSWINDQAFTRERLGYQFIHSKMGKVDAFVTKNLIKVKKEVNNIFDKNITSLVQKTNEVNAQI